MHRIDSSNFILDDRGRQIFKDSPPGTTITADWLNSIQEEIAKVIEMSGQSLNTKYESEYDQLYKAITRITQQYDVIVTSQLGFNEIIERTGANQYRIKSQYKSVYLENPGFAYAMAGALSPLSGGDTYGVLSTNQCVLLHAEEGSTINFDTTVGYFNVNTANATIEELEITGGFGVYSALPNYSAFVVAAEDVTVVRCVVHDFYNSDAGATLFFGFNGGAYKTAKFISCKVYNLYANNGRSGTAFYRCYNVNNATVSKIRNVNIDPATACRAFSECVNVNNIVISDVGSLTVKCWANLIAQCYNVSNVFVANPECLDSGGGFYISYLSNIISNIFFIPNANLNPGADAISLFYGTNNIKGFLMSSTAGGATISGGALTIFDSCINISSVYLSLLTLPAQINNIFNGCFEIENVYINYTRSNTASATNIFLNCNELSNCKIINAATNGAGANYIFNGCNNLTNCVAEVTKKGAAASTISFYNCNWLENCFADRTEGVGFSNCHAMMNCYASTTTGNGFDTCDNVTNSKAISCNIGFYSVQRITNCLAQTNISHGFQICAQVGYCNSLSNGSYGYTSTNAMGHNYATGNATGGYRACYANFGATSATADTATGGWNL